MEQYNASRDSFTFFTGNSQMGGLMNRWFLLSLVMLGLAAAAWFLLTTVPLGVKAGIPAVFVIIGFYCAYLASRENKRRENEQLYDAIRNGKR